MTNAKFIFMNIETEDKELTRHKSFISPAFARDHLFKGKCGIALIIKVLKKYNIDKSRMNRIVHLVDSFICQYQKVFALRFDLHHGRQNTEDSNSVLQRFLKQIKQRLKANYKSDIKVVWSCEKCKSLHHHYHVALLLNGNKVKTPQKVYKVVRELWERISGGIAPYIPHVHYNLVRKSDERFWITLQALFVRLSYLAKSETDYRPAGGKKFSFGMSRVNPEYIDRGPAI
ncbi:YagK/YfjJ domain-containing protein [Pseudoalteromonas sp. T1lg88]|uniref:YagK/YfjJ domain-containing protein n=1 Tax=Pseudoalteromonas sp. T1lg88 TaxID=2077104 RepID=UPI001319F036|nr:inovirus-type Gp2 protein [Pseudoalteromonas sp. T1lg88]